MATSPEPLAFVGGAGQEEKRSRQVEATGLAVQHAARAHGSEGDHGNATCAQRGDPRVEVVDASRAPHHFLLDRATQVRSHGLMTRYTRPPRENGVSRGGCKKGDRRYLDFSPMSAPSWRSPSRCSAKYSHIRFVK